MLEVSCGRHLRRDFWCRDHAAWCPYCEKVQLQGPDCCEHRCWQPPAQNDWSPTVEHAVPPRVHRFGCSWRRSGSRMRSRRSTCAAMAPSPRSSWPRCLLLLAVDDCQQLPGSFFARTPFCPDPFVLCDSGTWLCADRAPSHAAAPVHSGGSRWVFACSNASKTRHAAQQERLSCTGAIGAAAGHGAECGSHHRVRCNHGSPRGGGYAMECPELN